MSELIIIGYDNTVKAEAIRSKLIRMEQAYLIDLEDSVVAIKEASGKVHLNQAIPLTQMFAIGGGCWGALIGMIFLNPLLGAIAGAGAGAISGSLADVGINDVFIKDFAKGFQPGTSALFILIRKVTPDKVLEELKGSGGKILKTSLSHEDESRLQAALDPNVYDLFSEHLP